MLEVLFNKNKSTSMLQTLFDLLTHFKNYLRYSTRPLFNSDILSNIFWTLLYKSEAYKYEQ